MRLGDADVSGAGINGVPDCMRGEFWRDQALQDIMPVWLKHAPDREHGGFYTGLSREWKRIGPPEKYPTMLGRHLFSQAAAYLLSGDETYLRFSRDTTAYMIRHCWDHAYGGWFGTISETGAPLDTSKDAFTQLYANAGLALHFFATGDADARRYVEISNAIFEKQALDPDFGGYYTVLNRDLSVRSDRKSFNPQIGIASSYLLYFHLATGEAAYLHQTTLAIDLALKHMVSPRDGFVFDDFERDWTPAPRCGPTGAEALIVGGNIETSWILLRLYLLTGFERYRTAALELAEKMLKWGWDDEFGGWYSTLSRSDLSSHGPDKAWFMQAYGNFLLLCLYRDHEDPRYLEMFRRTSDFWNNYFLDKEFGGDLLSVDCAGRLLDGTKGLSAKGPYHTMEHDLLNYLYLNLYVHKVPVELHFCFSQAVAGEKRFVCLLEDPRVRIKEVFLNGNPWQSFDARERSVTLPEGRDMKVRVVLATED